MVLRKAEKIKGRHKSPLWKSWLPKPATILIVLCHPWRLFPLLRNIPLSILRNNLSLIVTNFIREVFLITTSCGASFCHPGLLLILSNNHSIRSVPLSSWQSLVLSNSLNPEVSLCRPDSYSSWVTVTSSWSVLCHPDWLLNPEKPQRVLQK